MMDGGPAPASHTPSCGSVRPRPGSDVVSSLRRGHATETWRRGLWNRPMLVAVKQSDESVWTESRPEWLVGVLPRVSTWAVRRWLIVRLGFGDTHDSASIPPRLAQYVQDTSSLSSVTRGTGHSQSSIPTHQTRHDTSRTPSRGPSRAPPPRPSPRTGQDHPDADLQLRLGCMSTPDQVGPPASA